MAAPRTGRRRRIGVALTALALAGCASAGPRIENGVFRAPALFRVAVPGPEWEVAAASRAELELRHRGGEAGIFANVECGEEAARRDVGVLARRLFLGLRDRRVVENGAATLDGAPAARAVIDARVAGRDEPLRLEAYVMKDVRCVYDLVYAAPPAVFGARRADFQRFVESFARE
ncbi:MAG: hypothetical protein FJZ38_10515 [Candidatus Rokubacteria bacterium]|nr:hypothetical protein [Candidatus Rokubacteria bacterium]